MYSTCLFCNNALGANEVVESFPVGRRLAFDQRLGRLWVVCRKCEKWNLTPLEERWEAIETCEQLFRDTRKRVSTDNIGLARLSEGLELVRIGEPQRPEFAAWRYGDQFGRRRRRANLFYGSVGIVSIAAVGAMIFKMVAGGVILGGALSALNGVSSYANLGRLAYRKRRVAARFDGPDGKQYVVRGGFAGYARLLPSDSKDGWALEVPCENGAMKQRLVVEGKKARWLAARIAPSLTADGGSKKEVVEATRRIEERGDPAMYLKWLAHNAKSVRQWSPSKDIVTGVRLKRGESLNTLGLQGLEVCLAVEMALNEENERIAFEGELAMLESAWKEAEEIAAIADRIALPSGIEGRLQELKSKDS